MHITSPDLSAYVLMGAGTLAWLVARKARKRTVALMPAVQAGDAEATAAARRESTIAMWGVIVGAVVWLAAIASSIHP
jgi:hypothetical protein